MVIRHRLAIMVSVAFALGAASCADGDSQTPAAASNPTEQDVAADSSEPPSETTDAEDPAAIETTKPDGPYVGEWHATLTAAQAQQRGDSRYAGDFSLTLNADGTYKASQSLDPPATGTYAAASGNRLVFTKDTGCDMNFGGVGVYRWKLTDDELTIRNVVPETGGCTGRTDTLTFPV